MAKRRQQRDSNELPPDSDGGSMEIVLTTEHMKMIDSLINHLTRIKMEQEALSEDVKAVAQKTNMKPGEVKEMVNWIMQEREKGGVLEAKEKKIEFMRQVLAFADNGNENG